MRFKSGEEFFLFNNVAGDACVLIDNKLPGMSGLDIQKRMIDQQMNLPVIFMSGTSDYQDVVEAVKKGAYSFLEKPFPMRKLQSILADTLANHQRQTATRLSEEDAKFRLECLTPRQSEIHKLSLKGYSIKHIAKLLCITPNTVEFHRSNVLKKLAVNSFSELMAQEIDKRQ